MIINVKLQELTNQDKKNIKLLLGDENDNHPVEIPIKYNWKLQGESTTENMQDLHLFCLSIVQDLFEKKFSTNEEGSFTYEQMENFDTEYILDNLHELYDMISKQKAIQMLK